jgi:AcrR family transcriptional regulator
MRTWTEDDPKAELMSRKRADILAAALDGFLEEGYAGSSVNRIASSAGVSITTLYRHFDSKDDLFVAVMEEACRQAEAGDPDWLQLPPLEGLTRAGAELLRHTLSEQQLALFRVVARDSPRFPELGRYYREQVIGARLALFARLVAGWPEELRAKVADPTRAAFVFQGLLHAGNLDLALLGGPVPDERAIAERAGEAARNFLTLAGFGHL